MHISLYIECLAGPSLLLHHIGFWKRLEGIEYNNFMLIISQMLGNKSTCNLLNLKKKIHKILMYNVLLLLPYIYVCKIIDNAKV